MRSAIPTLLAALLLAAGSAAAAAAPDTDSARALALVKAWVHGRYDNRAQFERDVARDLPPGQVHRLMHQLFVPVTVTIPGIEGYLVYQHASADGSDAPDAIFRVGLLQYLTDPESGQLIQRELMFKDGNPWKHAYRKPELLRKATMADFNVNPGCDFYLSTARQGAEIAGRMQERACTMFSPGINQTLYAEDAVVIRPAEYWFWGRFVDDTGKVRWGTESEELYQLQRVGGP